MRLVGLTCAALMMLAACSGEPRPIEPTSKPSPTEPASSGGGPSSLEPPKFPAAAKRNDETGAANFVLYWVKVANYASTSGETSLLKEISSPACGACNDYVDLYEKTYASGGFIRGGTDTLRDVSVERGSKEIFVRARVSSSAGTFKSSASSDSKPTPAETIWIIYAAQHTSDGWEMTQVGLDQ